MEYSGSPRGYLNERFRLFHTVDQTALRVEWHYHTFDKLVFFRGGHALYQVESETIALVPGDILAIAHGQLHRMEARSDAPYERFILYLDSGFLASLAPEAGGLNACFRRAQANGRSLIRLGETDRAAVYTLLTRMEKALREGNAYSPALSQALLTELLVLLCQAPETAPTQHPDARTDERIAQALHYIQAHLGEDLSCDTLAARMNMSRSSFQHRFRAATGQPPHAYIRLKRLLYASELLSAGASAQSARKQCGYRDHSAFCHAFSAQFGMPPSAFRPRSTLTGPEE